MPTVTPAKRRRTALVALAVALGGALLVALLVLPRARRGGAEDPAAPEARGADTPTKPGARRRGANVPRFGAKAASVETLVTASWGAGVGALGREIPKEGAPLGPMSFVVDGQGNTHVLDQVNGRIQVFGRDGSKRVIPLPHGGFDDLQIDPRGGYVLLARGGEGGLTFLDDRGGVRGAVPFEAASVDSGGLVTHVEARADGVWIEVNNETSMRMADADGRRAPAAPPVPGRLTPDGQASVQASLDGTTVTLARKAIGERGGAAARIELPIDAPVDAVTTFGQDASGRTLVAVRVTNEIAGRVMPTDMVIAVDAKGTEVARAVLPAPDPQQPLDHFQSVRIGPDGTVYRMTLADDGVRVEKVSL